MGAVEDPGADIPGLERLMRAVVRQVCNITIGHDWLTNMSQSVTDSVARAAALAHAQRPSEVLQDDWEAVGLAEIGALLRSWWTKIGGSLTPLWAKAVEADVDLERLLSQRAEVAAIITRLRIGFEQVRRNLLPASSTGSPSWNELSPRSKVPAGHAAVARVRVPPFAKVTGSISGSSA
jgi:hypothetical protein